MGYKSKMCHVIPTTPLSGMTTSAGWDLLLLIYRPNLKFITIPIMKTAMQNVQIGVVWGT